MRQLIQQINNKVEIMARIFVVLNQQENKIEHIKVLHKIELEVPEKKEHGLSASLPVRTALADESARSRADFPSVFRMFGSAPCCSSTVQGKQRQYLTSGIQRLFTGKCRLGMA